MSSGKIAQVIGPVVDVLFAAGEKLPEINNALVVYKNDEKKTKIVLEVALELGDGMIRTIAWINRWFDSWNGSVGHRSVQSLYQ